MMLRIQPLFDWLCAEVRRLRDRVHQALQLNAAATDALRETERTLRSYQSAQLQAYGLLPEDAHIQVWDGRRWRHYGIHPTSGNHLTPTQLRKKEGTPPQ